MPRDSIETPARVPGFVADTHEVVNVGRELEDYNLYAADLALREAVAREGAGWAEAGLEAFGAAIGAAGYLEHGRLANRFPPELETHDRFGRRLDLVTFHPSYHALMTTAVEHGLHCSPWAEPGPGAHVARAAKFYLHTQVEAGHGCPISMTFAVLPALRLQPDVAAEWEPRVCSRVYDARNVPAALKSGITVGMAMTEKQGGSDVRANTTRAHPAGSGGPGTPHELVGHKFFVSAPMCDAFLVLAQAPGGLSCFLVPRWRPDGTRNPIEIVRLKRKMGNASNATAEAELRGALGWMVGEEGRGVRTIIEMVAMTRFDCVLGSAAGQRLALSHAIDHCRRRSAFGAVLVHQPLMRNVLADLALEHEGAIALAMRLARAMDHRSDRAEDLLVRLAVPVAKYWVCKRTPAHAFEAMECIGGSGVMEDGPMPRLFRESPVNAIWEGSGNVQCLDVLRAMRRTPDTVEAFLAEVRTARGGHDALDAYADALADDLLHGGAEAEFGARRLVERLALALQAALLVKHAPSFVADAFCRSRLAEGGHHHFGTLPPGADGAAIIDRAWPERA
ncbi:MAG: isovaleryl-CoA dehydrogenase [Vicinamibacteraceae bacterium]|nr:isovaleryl-CoA dehydrogenase [Vicinamibacteraceae bacterium]